MNRIQRGIPTVLFLSTSVAIGFAVQSMAQMPLGEGKSAIQDERQAVEPLETEPATPEPADGQGMMQCPMMAGLKGIEMFADSPEVLLAQADELQLTDRQKDQLKKTQETARRQARNVLTAEQQQTLKEAPTGRLSMAEINRMRVKRLAAQRPGTMCPMCMRMMQKQPEAGKKQEEGGRNGHRHKDNG